MTFPANIFANSINESISGVLDGLEVGKNIDQPNGTVSSTQSLNPEQLESVTHIGSPLLVVAGAGSGKTRVLTNRIAHLIEEHHVSPHQILAITFTNKAAAEMVRRVEKIVGPIANKMWVSTFHSACSRILRYDGDVVGVKNGFTIYDTVDAARLVDYSRRDIGADPKRFGSKAVYRNISSMKNEMITPKVALERAEMDSQETIAKIYAEYEHRLRNANAVDFDDLLLKVVEMFRTSEEKLLKYQERFQHVLVDEFQDTNLAQFELVSQIAKNHRNITVVGDGDQSIYKFRGADHKNFQKFEEKFDEAKTVILNTNYRSTENILQAANSVISHNSNRIEKDLISDKGIGEPITVFYAASDRSESQYVISQMAKDAKKYSLNEMAIFYRTNAQSRLLEEQLIRQGIPYRIVGGTKFFERKEIKDAIAYLRIFANPSDEASWRRIINEPKRGLGDTSVAKITNYARMHEISFRKSLEQSKEYGLSKKATSSALSVCALFDNAGNGEQIKIGEILEYLLNESGYKKSLSDDGSFEADGRLENLSELINQAKEFDLAIEKSAILFENESKGKAGEVSQFENDGLVLMANGQLVDEHIDITNLIERVSAFLEAVSLLSESDQAKENDEAITLMTLHTAKGLEYQVVAIVGLEEGLFPHERSLGDVSELEEERRLMYVGVTRAMEKLYLTCALSRMLYATPEFYSPSRFLREIPGELVNVVKDSESVNDSFASRMSGRTNNDSFKNTHKSRYGAVYDEIVFDDLETQADDYLDIDPRSIDFKTKNVVSSSIFDLPGRDSKDKIPQEFNIDGFNLATRVAHNKYGDGIITQVETHRSGDVAITVVFDEERKQRTFMASLNPPIEIIE